MVTRAEMGADGPRAAPDGQSVWSHLWVPAAFLLFCIREQGPGSVGACELPESPTLLVLTCLCLEDLDLHDPKRLCFVFLRRHRKGVVVAAGGRGEESMGKGCWDSAGHTQLGVLR